jgi:putative membrane protein
MLNLLGHAGRPLAPHDLWGAWTFEPLVLVGLAGAIWLFARGLARSRVVDLRRAWCFAGAVLTIVVALVSPLDSLSGSLASAHMTQHILLVLVAAPLLVLSAPAGTLLRGMPGPVLRALGRWRARPRLAAPLRPFRDPVVAWVVSVGTLWFWHASVPYDAAVNDSFVHALEHATFLLTSVMFWASVAGIRARRAGNTGFAMILVLGMAIQSVFLAALITFSTTPWYSAYATTTRVWGLSPLQDQQLAGVIMWVPGGVVYVAAGLALLVAWLREAERPAPIAEGAERSRPSSFRRA